MEKHEISTVRRASDLPVSTKSSVSSGLVHHIESTTASVKLSGYKVRTLSDTESEFTSSEEEERDYTITEIDLSKEVAPLSGLEDTEPLSDKDDSFSVSLKNSCNIKEQANSPLETPDTVIREVVEEAQKKSDLKRVFSEVRFNPFDRDLHMEEEHYTDDGIPTLSSEQEYKSSMLFLVDFKDGLFLISLNAGFCNFINYIKADFNDVHVYIFSAMVGAILCMLSEPSLAPFLVELIVKIKDL